MMEVIHINDGCVGIAAQIYHHHTINLLIRIHVMKREETLSLVGCHAFARFSLDQIKSINVRNINPKHRGGGGGGRDRVN